MVDNLLSRIEELKRRKGAVILAHYYTLPEVQAVADFLGDSLALSIEAQKVEARTSVEIKAQPDVCCTSSNALKVVESIPAEQPILFAPDRNLGAYVQKLTGRTNMVLWDGACHVHEEFSLEKLLALREEHPGAEVVAHPECRAYITAVADFVGSTAAILDYCGRSDAQEFIVVTEAGILAEMQRRYPRKRFIPAPPDDDTCGCNNCVYMKMVTLERIAPCLENESPEVVIDEQVRRAAERSIRRMIEIG